MNLLPPIPYEEAQQRLLALANPMGKEVMPLGRCLARYLSEPLTARRTQPPADLSAMDGYAVAAETLDGPLRVVGESAAGHPYHGRISPDEAVRISTGALLPEGARAILLQENAKRDGDALRCGGPDMATPDHIRRAGLDFRTGDLLIESGTLITAPHVALALSGGHAAAFVGRQPTIAVIDNGDELAADPTHVADHQIPASNGAMIAAMAAPFASEIKRLGPVPDKQGALADALHQASGADVIVTSGGASVGDHDLVRPALADWGAKLDFWRIAMKPGKPLLVATRGNQIILGLPGNPVSSYVTAWLFLLPLLRRLAGATRPLPEAIALPVAEDLPANGARATFMRAQLTPQGAAPLQQQDSSALVALAASDALIARPINAPIAAKGSLVPVFFLRFPTGD